VSSRKTVDNNRIQSQACVHSSSLALGVGSVEISLNRVDLSFNMLIWYTHVKRYPDSATCFGGNRLLNRRLAAKTLLSRSYSMGLELQHST
jgi:hypothetical protein